MKESNYGSVAFQQQQQVVPWPQPDLLTFMKISRRLGGYIYYIITMIVTDVKGGRD